jgi:hypothetical protein
MIQYKAPPIKKSQCKCGWNFTVANEYTCPVCSKWGDEKEMIIDGDVFEEDVGCWHIFVYYDGEDVLRCSKCNEIISSREFL